MDGQTWLVLAALAALVMLAYAAVLLVRVFKARKLLVEAGIPLRNKALFWGAVIYTISPVDLLPDPIYLDDIGVLLIALKALHSAARRAGLDRADREDSRPAVAPKRVAPKPGEPAP
ncbi:YkvA family protein [Streptomyces sp. NPDC059639]|uniref:YkvA family protein n=1 Tax=Streptomyces sp. NPDC059639 TaxID=3346891 RepID=UPI003689696F